MSEEDTFLPAKTHTNIHLTSEMHLCEKHIHANTRTTCWHKFTESPVINVAGYLDVDQELLEIFGRHDNRCVQVDDVASVQIQVEVSGQFLIAQNDTGLFTQKHIDLLIN